MSSKEEKPASQEDILDLNDLNVVPEWVRNDPSTPTVSYEDRHQGERRGGGRGDRQRQGGRDRRQGRTGGYRGGGGGGGGKPRRPPQGDRQGGRDRDSRSFSRSRDESRPRARPVFPHVLDFSFLPERHGLGVLVRKIKSTQRAYPLAKLAELCLKKPEFFQVKIESKPAAQGEKPHPMWQCQQTGALFLSREGWESFAVRSVLDQAFDKVEEEGEAPTGTFVCVARCGLSGELLGPPNHHDYNQRLRQIWTSRYGHMRFEDYCARVETVRDEEAIEAWKQQAARTVRYREQGNEDAPLLTWEEARQRLVGDQNNALVKSVHRAIVTPPVLMEQSDPELQHRCREAMNRETRFPGSMLRSLRPAFRHMGLHTFKMEGNRTFVTMAEPHRLPPEQAVPEVRAILEALSDHPGLTQETLLEHLAPGADPKSPEAQLVLKHLRWLTERGHVLAFFDGSLALPQH